AALIAACAHGASPAPYDPIRLHPDNPRYFIWRDKPTVLIGATEEFCAVVNAPFDYKTYLDTIAADRSNVISVITGILLERGGRSTMAVAEGQLLPPWARSDTPGYTGGGNKFDLSRWDPAHFARLCDFVAEAGKRGIVVNVIILSAAYNDVHWSLNPFNPVNNVNGIDARVARNEILTIDRHGGLLEYQEALVRKIVTELRPFENVIYTINYRRGPNNTMEWERHMIDVLDQAQQAVGDRKLMAVNLGTNTQPGQEVDPRISVVDHINASPAAVAAHATANRAVGLSYLARELLSDPFARMRAWEFILAGAGMFIHGDASFSVRSPRGESQAPVTALSGGGPNQRRSLRILTEFMDTLDYLHLRPAPELLAEPLPDGLHGRVLARPGKSYVVYVRIPSPDLRKARIVEPNGKVTFDKVVLASLVPQPSPRRLTLRLNVTPGLYQIEWVTPATGEVARVKPVQHSGGTLTLETPVFSEDIALRLLRDQSAVSQR
ncbi:MAG: hypothetical protein ACREH8_09445, partial [Opitutaceae bacterium]